MCRYRKGKEVVQGRTTKFTLNDPYSVFQNVANTPGYHKKGKMEMIARLDNFGPFHVFFTVSCADYKWPENLISVLRENRCSISCTVESDQTETYSVQSQEGDWIPLDEYMESEVDQGIHEILRRNVVTATRNYQQRFKAVMDKIIRSPFNPLSVKHYASKLEFQARGNSLYLGERCEK